MVAVEVKTLAPSPLDFPANRQSEDTSLTTSMRALGHAPEPKGAEFGSFDGRQLCDLGGVARKYGQRARPQWPPREPPVRSEFLLVRRTLSNVRHARVRNRRRV